MNLKKIAITISVIIGILILTNPSLKDFIEFSNELDTKRVQYNYNKENNFIIFSIFRKSAYDVQGLRRYKELKSVRCIGVLKNFYIIR